jgi:hypothetical protein
MPNSWEKTGLGELISIINDNIPAVRIVFRNFIGPPFRIQYNKVQKTKKNPAVGGI